MTEGSIDYSFFFFFFFFFNDTATTEIYTLSLHDALPISASMLRRIAEIGESRRVVPRAERELRRVRACAPAADPEAPLARDGHGIGTCKKRHLADEHRAVEDRRAPHDLGRWLEVET